MQYWQDIVTHICSSHYGSGVNYYPNSNHLPYEVFGTTLRPTFYVLEHFHRKFAICVAPPTDITMNRLVRCKIHLVL